MKRRKAPVRAAERRSRTATRSRTGDAAWKRAEREVARYFGTERTGLGRAGHDLAEVPTVQGWLSLRAPQLIVAGMEEPKFIFVDSKCHKTLLPTLEQWQAVVESNPDKKHFLPVMFLGERDFTLPPPFNQGAVGLCKLEDFPKVYRTFVAQPPDCTPHRGVAQIVYRFWMIRRPVAPMKLITDALEQALVAGINWCDRKMGDMTTDGPEVIKDADKLLPLAYLYYPKRLTPALAFHLKVPR